MFPNILIKPRRRQGLVSTRSAPSAAAALAIPTRPTAPEQAKMLISYFILSQISQTNAQPPRSTTNDLGVSPQRSPISPGVFGTLRAAFFCANTSKLDSAAGHEQHRLLQAPGLRPAHRYESPGAPGTARGNISGCLHSLCACAP